MLKSKRYILMRYYKNLTPEARRRTVLGAVAFSSAMEGMNVAHKTCCKELQKSSGKFHLIKRSSSRARG
jgi:hypothetical protein